MKFGPGDARLCVPASKVLRTGGWSPALTAQQASRDGHRQQESPGVRCEAGLSEPWAATPLFPEGMKAFAFSESHVPTNVHSHLQGHRGSDKILP